MTSLRGGEGGARMERLIWGKKRGVPRRHIPREFLQFVPSVAASDVLTFSQEPTGGEGLLAPQTGWLPEEGSMSKANTETSGREGR